MEPPPVYLAPGQTRESARCGPGLNPAMGIYLGAALLVFLFLANFAPSDAIAHESFGSYTYSTSSCTSGNEVDPVSLAFHHAGNISTVVSHFQSDAGWGTGGSTTGQYFWTTHSSCALPEQSVTYNLSLTRRYHARLKAGSDSGLWGDYTYGTPHYEKVDFLCNPPYPDHVSTSFVVARNAALSSFRSAHWSDDNAEHRHHFVWWANTKAIQQCDGSWVQSDGWLGFVDLTFDNHPSVSGFWISGQVYSRHYVQDDNGRIWERYQNVSSGAWSGWQYLDSPPNGCSSGPGSIGDLLSYLAIYCREQSQDSPQAPYNSRIWRRQYYQNGQWNPWVALQSYYEFESTSYGAPGSMLEYEFSVARNGNAYWRYYDYNAGLWYNWQLIGTPTNGCSSRPGGAKVDASNIYALCRNGSGGVWYTKWNGSSWSSWISLGYPPSGGTWKEGPAAAVTGTTIYVLATDSFGNVWETHRTGGGAFSAWLNLYGACAGSPYAAVLPNNWIDISCRWTDAGQNVYYRRYNGSWGPGWYQVGKP